MYVSGGNVTSFRFLLLLNLFSTSNALKKSGLSLRILSVLLILDSESFSSVSDVTEANNINILPINLESHLETWRHTIHIF